ncbi:hypothetical protein BOTBODRAFT_35077 [Botryobasidium botryosum FD-172 SS1]|uniref:Uncharacterized protein n=1 Tax=Botryobasidium botryosum (strain FD-172 SS1) TaxID=930990 RepID=A0A067MJW0_BOTB1|nr:hypothetical protein BOTBODRAFT_35077 [Botryobasidium botryosum FD-172 SS1]
MGTYLPMPPCPRPASTPLHFPHPLHTLPSFSRSHGWRSCRWTRARGCSHELLPVQ